MPEIYTLLTPERRAQKLAEKRRYYARHRVEILSKMRDGYVLRREAKLAYGKTYYQKHAEIIKQRVRKYWLKTQLKSYGLTIAEYRAMVERQNGVCAICHGATVDRRKQRLEIDHDHTTGRVRGLLCSACNVAIGLLRERQDICVAAARYLGSD